MNCVQVTGRLVRDPEVKKLRDGRPLCVLRLAVEQMGRDRQAGFVDVTTFGAAAEACGRVLSRGWTVAVDGRLDYREWEQDGSRRSAISLIGHVEFLGAPRNQGNPGTLPASTGSGGGLREAA